MITAVSIVDIWSSEIENIRHRHEKLVAYWWIIIGSIIIATFVAVTMFFSLSMTADSFWFCTIAISILEIIAIFGLASLIINKEQCRRSASRIKDAGVCEVFRWYSERKPDSHSPTRIINNSGNSGTLANGTYVQDSIWLLARYGCKVSKEQVCLPKKLEETVSWSFLGPDKKLWTGTALVTISCGEIDANTVRNDYPSDFSPRRLVAKVSQKLGGGSNGISAFVDSQLTWATPQLMLSKIVDQGDPSELVDRDYTVISVRVIKTVLSQRNYRAA